MCNLALCNKNRSSAGIAVHTDSQTDRQTLSPSLSLTHTVRCRVLVGRGGKQAIFPPLTVTRVPQSKLLHITVSTTCHRQQVFLVQCTSLLNFILGNLSGKFLVFNRAVSCIQRTAQSMATQVRLPTLPLLVRANDHLIVNILHNRDFRGRRELQGLLYIPCKDALPLK